MNEELTNEQAFFCALYEWFMSGEKRDFTLYECDEEGNPVKAWEFKDAIPDFKPDMFWRNK